MRIGSPVNQRYYKSTYDPLRGRESLTRHNGFFTNSLRAIGLGKLAHDQENGLLVNHVMPNRNDAVGLIDHFICLGSSSEPVFFHDENKSEYLRLGLENFPISKRKVLNTKLYRIKIPVGRQSKETRELRLFAKDNQDALKKLNWIFQSPTARSKLIFKVNKINPAVKGYIFFDEQHIISGTNKIQKFFSRNTSQEAETFDSAIGSSDSKQINYFSPSILNIGRYADKDEPSVDIRDRMWDRIEARSRTLLDCNDTDELIGNIYHMFSENDTNPEAIAHTVRALREDYIYNLHGNPGKIMRQIDHFPDSYRTDKNNKSGLSHIRLGANPLHGGRFWKTSPADLKETLLHLYHSDGTGNIIFKYHSDPEKFCNTIRKNFMIQATDRQYMAGYSRKILGLYTVLDFLREEINNTHKNNALSNDKKQKQLTDLSQLSDDLFDSAGDLKDSLRHDFSGFSQFCHAVGKNTSLASVNDDMGSEEQKHVADKQGFSEKLQQSLEQTTENYTYINMLLNSELRTVIGNNLYKNLKHSSFDKHVSDIVSASGGIMMLQGLEKTSGYLRNLLGGMEYHTNLYGVFGYLLQSAHNGDEKALRNATKVLHSKFSHLSQGELLKKGVKYRTLLSEAIFHIRHSPPNKLEPYPKDDRQKEMHNMTTSAYRLAEVNGESMANHLLDCVKLFSHQMDHIRSEMKSKKQTDPYKTQSFYNMTKEMHDVSVKMAENFMIKHKHIWGDSNKNVMKTVYNHLIKTYFSQMQLMANATAMIRDNPAVIYSDTGFKDAYMKPLKNNTKNFIPSHKK